MSATFTDHIAERSGIPTIYNGTGEIPPVKTGTNFIEILN